MDDQTLIDGLTGAAGEAPGPDIDRIKARGSAIRRRRRVGAAVVVGVLVLGGAMVPVALGGDDDDRSVVFTDDEGATSTSQATSTTDSDGTTTTDSTSSTSAPPVDGPTPGEPPTEQPAPEVTTTTETCLNAFNRPECGAPYFVYDGPNLPAELVLSSEALPEGATRITGAWSDPDLWGLSCWWVDFGDGSPIVAAPEYVGPGDEPYGDCRTSTLLGLCEHELAFGNGPQQFTPAPGSKTVVVDHTFAAGTYQVTFVAESLQSYCPTASDVTATLTITVP